MEAADCTFCRIGREELDSSEIICTGRTWVAFFPLSPATPGHTLITPRMHVADLWHLKPDQGADLTAAAILVGRAIKIALEPEGMNLITSAGRVAEQTMFHLHLHIVPRWQGDGFGPIWNKPATNRNVDLGELRRRIQQVYDHTRP